MKKLKSFFDHLEIWIVCGVFMLLLALMFGQVIARYVFSVAFGWAEQMARLMFVFITFAGMSYAAKANAHLKVSFLAEFIPNKKIANFIYLIGDLICCVVVFYLSYLVWNLTMKVAAEGQVFSAAQFCPVWVMYLGGCLGLLGLGIRTLQYGVCLDIKRMKESNKPTD